MNAEEIRDMWAAWDAHEQVISPYRVCREGCREEWPCAPRQAADTGLRAMGIDPYAIRRGEVTIPA